MNGQRRPLTEDGRAHLEESRGRRARSHAAMTDADRKRLDEIRDRGPVQPELKGTNAGGKR